MCSVLLDSFVLEQSSVCCRSLFYLFDVTLVICGPVQHSPRILQMKAFNKHIISQFFGVRNPGTACGVLAWDLSWGCSQAASQLQDPRLLRMPVRWPQFLADWWPGSLVSYHMGLSLHLGQRQLASPRGVLCEQGTPSYRKPGSHRLVFFRLFFSLSFFFSLMCLYKVNSFTYLTIKI